MAQLTTEVGYVTSPRRHRTARLSERDSLVGVGGFSGEGKLYAELMSAACESDVAQVAAGAGRDAGSVRRRLPDSGRYGSPGGWCAGHGHRRTGWRPTLGHG